MKMQIDSKQLYTWLNLIKSLNGELLAYRTLYEFVRDSGRFSLPELTTCLAQAQASAQQEMNSKYDEALQMLAYTPDIASADRALKFLAEWTPKGKPS